MKRVHFQERLPCHVPADCAGGIPGLGFLDPSQGEADLASDTKLELPVWMVGALKRRARMPDAKLRVSVPDLYTYERRSGVVRADPNVLDLPR